MFDFLSSDWFTIVLEIVFLVFIVYDTKLYMRTKKNEYLINIVLTIGFFIWTMLPFYNEYITWDETQRKELSVSMENEYNQTLGSCLSDALFKEYSYSAYTTVDPKEYKKFLKDAKEECLDDSWF